MEKEFGKWFLDVAKYVLTAGILSAVFADMRGSIGMYFVAGFIFVGFVAMGVVCFLWNSKEKFKKEEEKLCKD
jgi:hypothetical protein